MVALLYAYAHQISSLWVYSTPELFVPDRTYLIHEHLYNGDDGQREGM